MHGARIIETNSPVPNGYITVARFPFDERTSEDDVAED